jgi:hypothetical protein
MGKRQGGKGQVGKWQVREWHGLVIRLGFLRLGFGVGSGIVGRRGRVGGEF